jgi:tRNA(Arg) A34 adenosine deaminase TadA
MANPSFMRAAIEAAKESKAAGDYAVGSVIVHEGQIIAKGGNRTHLDRDPTQHAELIAIRQAARVLGSKDLSRCTLFATHEPCPMCMGGIIWSRISKVFFGATIEDHMHYRDLRGNSQWRWRVINVPAKAIATQGDPVVELVGGFMREECLALFHS